MNKISIKNIENNCILWSSDNFLSSKVFACIFNRMEFIMFFAIIDYQKGEYVRELFI